MLTCGGREVRRRRNFIAETQLAETTKETDGLPIGIITRVAVLE